MRILSVSFLLVWAFCDASAQQASVYHDPQGRYATAVPGGFSVSQLNNDAVQFAGGGGYVTAMVLPGTDPGMMLDAIARQTGAQWRNFAEARRGEARFGGRTGPYVTYSGVNPRGADSYLQMLAVTDGTSTYLLMSSAAKSDFLRLKSAFDQIEQGFKLIEARAPVALPPPPAGAVSRSPATRTPGAQAAPKTVATPPATPASATAGGPSYYRMHLVKVVDEHGFERPMTALSLLVPTDWRFQGGVQYGQATGCHANLVKLMFQAESPDGRFAMQMFPGNTWQWSDDPNSVRMLQMSNQQMAQFGARGCDIQPPMSAADYLRRAIIPALRRGARVVAIEPMADLAPQVERQARELEQIAAQQGIRVRVRLDVARARLSYQSNGQAVEEWLTAMTFATGMPGPTLNMYTGRMGQTTFYTCGADHIFALRAPEGQLDTQEKFFRTLLSTIRVDPQWQAQVTQVIANMQAADAKGVHDRTEIITKNGQDISKIIHDTYQNSTQSRDRSMEGWSQYMRGVQTYRNPYTGDTVELSNQYEHAWAGPNNEYVVTDSANFNPNAALQGNWTRLDAVQR
jgi:hypothetical protein